MGWQENRRRKRWWYLRYKWVAEDLARTISRGGATLADILLVVHRHTERGRHYGSGFRARSAVESIRLVSSDLDLHAKSVLVQPSLHVPVREDATMPIGQAMLQSNIDQIHMVTIAMPASPLDDPLNDLKE